jgi:cytochrome c oxidase subunit 3
MKNSSALAIPGHTYQTGVALFIAAIIMMVAGITSMVVVRQASADDWGKITLPPLVYVLTFLLVLSSVTLEIGKQRLGRSGGVLALYASLGFGIFFFAGTIFVCERLIASGVHIASSPAGATFYLLVGIYGVHFLGAIIALGYLLVRIEKSSEKFAASLRALSLYWHFMTALWIYILLLLSRG